MAIYEYKAKNCEGKTLIRTVECYNKDEAVEYLLNLQLIPLKIKETKKLPFGSGGISKKSFCIFFRQFSQMLDAGLNINTSLQELSCIITNSALKRKTKKICDEVQKGRSLSECFRDERLDFAANMISIGESSGNMPTVLSNLSIHYEKEVKHDDTIRNALIYPAFVIALMFVVLTIAFSFLIPRFQHVYFQELDNAALPYLTTALISSSGFIANNAIWIVALLVSIIASFLYYRTTPSGAKMIEAFILKLPIASNLKKLEICSRLCRNMSLLLSSGFNIIDALEKSKLSLNYYIAQKAIDEALYELHCGRNMSEAFEKYNFVSPLLLNMLKTCEATGNPSVVMSKAADYIEQEFDSYSTFITKLIGPIATAVIGLIVAIIMMALVLPVFNISNLI